MEIETTSGPVSFGYDEAGVLLDALERYAVALRHDPYYTRQNSALNEDAANDCDIFVGRILEHFGTDPRLT